MTEPYRQMVPIVPPQKQVDGLIVVPYQKPPKPHRCNQPSVIWRKLCFWLPRFAAGTMFRCPKCKQIWRLGLVRWSDLEWEYATIEQWKAVGGVE